MERVLEERSRELILPLVEQPATESKPAVVSDVSAEIPAALPRPMRVATAAPMTPGALRTSDGIIQIGPFTEGDHHRPWTGTEDHSSLAPQWTISRTKTTASAATESE